MNGQKAGSMNTILMAVVGLLIGFIGGYFIGHGSAPTAAQQMTAQTSTQQVFCPHQLDGKDQWILAGYRCPATDTAQVALLECHCNTSHDIHDKVKQEMAAGRTGQQIRTALEMEYGTRLKFRGQ